MSGKVKKFFKWFLIISLVVASVAMTVFLFLKKVNSMKIEEVDLLEVVSAQEEFNEGFDSVVQIVEAEGKTDWFADLKSTKENLDDAMSKLSNHYVVSNFKVKEREISSTYTSMQTTRNLLMDMFDEYENKSTSAYFPRLIGANDIYVTYSNYLTKYAKFVMAVNNDLKSGDNFMISDIKYALIDLQSRIVINTFAKIEIVDDLKIIENDDNLDAINGKFNFDNSLIESDENISLNAIKFVQMYNRCDQNKLAKNFNTILSLAGIDSTSTLEQKAAFYFKEIF